VNGQKYVASDGKPQIGLLIKRSDVDTTLFLEEHQRVPQQCLLQNDKLVNAAQGDKLVPFDGTARQLADFTIAKDQQGFYNTYFINCLHQPVSFQVKSAAAAVL
jgi:hypothetical protein